MVTWQSTSNDASSSRFSGAATWPLAARAQQSDDASIAIKNFLEGCLK